MECTCLLIRHLESNVQVIVSALGQNSDVVYVGILANLLHASLRRLIYNQKAHFLQLGR